MIDSFGKVVFFSGIGGISMSALAELFIKNGHVVFGSDDNLTQESIKKLSEMGAVVYKGQSMLNIINSSPDTYIYSVAIKEDNEEVIQARKSCSQVLSRGQAFGLISKSYEKLIAVAGSHGKTTCSALISHILHSLGYKPTAFIGGSVKNFNTQLLLGEKELLVLEACEYYNSFLNFNSYIAVVLNLQDDHMDYFKTSENLKKSFKIFVGNTIPSGFVILNKDDENLIDFNVENRKCYYFSLFDKGADIYVEKYAINDEGHLIFDCNLWGEKVSNVYLPLIGEHNLYNAVCSILVCRILGVSTNDIVSALRSFKGIARRYEFSGFINGAKVINDYAHHPTEITRVILETKKIVKGRVFCLFQSHTYSRTKELWDDFCDALSIADVVVGYPIYPAREQPIYGVTMENMIYEIRRKNRSAVYFDNYDDILKYLKNNVQQEDCVLVLGAGDIVNFLKFI